MKNHHFLLTIIINIITLFVTSYFIYSLLLLTNIENIGRIIACFICISIYLLFIFLLVKYQKKKKILLVLDICFTLYSLIIFFISFNIHKIYKTIDHISSNYIVQKYSIITLIENDNKDLNDGKIGVLIDDLNHQQIIDSYKINKENTTEMDSYIDLLNSLYIGDITYAVMPSNYISLFEHLDSFSTLKNDTKTIYTKEIKHQISMKDNNINNPFTILLMGVDAASDDINASSNGDALMLLTFNPDKNAATILSIPRDTYTSISCFKDERKNKITHAAWNGDDCMIKTIENLFDIDVNYYFKVNFQGVIQTIDMLGGIETYVPLSFCESDSNRDLSNPICLEEGVSVLNGEEVLALARHRKTINDIIRGENQQYIVEGLMNKLKNIDNLDIIYSILDTISHNMETNMQTDEILALYNYVKKAKNTSINKLSIDGYDEYIYDYDMLNGQGTKLTLYNFIPYNESLKEVINKMKDNLNLKQIEMVSRDVDVLPNFVGKTKQEAINYGLLHNLKVNVEYVTSNSIYHLDEITEQDIEEGMDLSYIPEDGLTIKVVNKIESPIKINCAKEENRDNELCLVPDFTFQNYTEFTSWLKNNNYSFRTSIIEIKKGEKGYDANKKGKIIKQNLTNVSIYDVIGKKLEITYITEK